MTVTRDQAQMLATLAIDCRPYRAPTWDHAGVMAAIAEIRNMSLARGHPARHPCSRRP
jgi:hypothetical protein